MQRRYNPTPNELHECEPVPFREDDYFEADETREPARVAARKARHEAKDAARVAVAVAHVEKVRREGIDVGPGTVKGYAYRMGQNSRRK